MPYRKPATQLRCGMAIDLGALETAIEKGTTSAAEKGTSRQSKREPPDAKYSAGWLTEVVFLQSTRQEGSTGAFNGRFRTNSQAGSC